MGYFHNATADGPLYVLPIVHVDLLHYVYFLMCVIASFFVYLILPRGFRVQYCNSHPKYYARSSRYMAMRSRSRRNRNQNNGSNNGSSNSGSDRHYWDNVIMSQQSNAQRELQKHQDIGASTAIGRVSSNPTMESSHEIPPPMNLQHSYNSHNSNRMTEESPPMIRSQSSHHSTGTSFQSPPKSNSPIRPKALYHTQPDDNPNHHQQQQQQHLQQIEAYGNTTTASIPVVSEVVVSATMQELRDPGLRLIAHGTKSKPRGIWLQLHHTVLIWQTESPSKQSKDKKDSPKKLIRGKEHHVPLVDILYVDVGKHTDALRKIENASVLEEVCFSLLTKRGSLDLQAYSVVQRDALVSCFSLVLDEIHANHGDWRKIYRAPSSEYPSSIDAPSGIDNGMMSRDLVNNSEC